MHRSSSSERRGSVSSVVKEDVPMRNLSVGEKECAVGAMTAGLEAGSEFNVDKGAEGHLAATKEDLEQARGIAAGMSAERLVQVLKRVVNVHQHDANFPHEVMQRIKAFMVNTEALDHPESHDDLVNEMKLEAALITNNSPYAEVRAVVENTDNPALPCFTFRVWVLGIIFCVVFSALNQIFDIRQPGIRLAPALIQLLAFPAGKLLAKLPDWGMAIKGQRYTINPGPFNNKEHMLINIFAGMSFMPPYTTGIYFIQYLPNFFNQPWAIQFGYQILMALSTQFLGFGLSGLTRDFLVYPSHCVWPVSLSTLALNKAFHADDNQAVRGPFGYLFTISRLRCFLYVCITCGVYYWIPAVLAKCLSGFDWIVWAIPKTAEHYGIFWSIFSTEAMGMNPFPTLDPNVIFSMVDPLLYPFFTTMTLVSGMFFAFPFILLIWFMNVYNTGYLPVLDTHTWDHFGQPYNVSRIIDEDGLFSQQGYDEYSPAFMAPSHILTYCGYFAMYAATVSYSILYHGSELKLAVRSLWESMPWVNSSAVDEGRYDDVHNRLMGAYKEVPHWWYGITLVLSMAAGLVGLLYYPTHTSPAVVFYGILLCLLFVLPTGIILAVSGFPVTLNVLAEFIGGIIAEGNPLEMNYFKTFGYVTCSHALIFSGDLKLAHYAKIPPRHTYVAQMAGAFIVTFVSLSIAQFQMTGIPNVCTDDAPGRMYCPGENIFFTASIFWGVIGPRKIWGYGGQYVATLVAFPIGFALPFLTFWLRKKFPNLRWIRDLHPVIFVSGCSIWGPYGFNYFLPALMVSWVSWRMVRTRFLAFWCKYNYIVSAGVACGIAISAVIIFFSLEWKGTKLKWAANTVGKDGGCELSDSTHCGRLIYLEEGEHF